MKVDEVIENWENGCLVQNGVIRGDGERLLSKPDPTFS